MTLMTDDQVRDVRSLTRLAGIKPTTTKIDSARHPVLQSLAPGDRVLVPGGYEAPAPVQAQSSGAPKAGGRNRQRRKAGTSPNTRSGQPKQGSGQGGRSSASSSGGQRGAGQGGGQGGGRGRGQRSGGSSSHSAASFSGRR